MSRMYPGPQRYLREKAPAWFLKMSDRNVWKANQPVHQMAIPLRKVFASWSVDAPLVSEDPATLPDLTFDGLLNQDKPSLDVLNVVKRLARKSARDNRTALPVELANVFYFATIALALVRCDKRISRSDDEVVQMGLHLACRWSWIDERLRNLYIPET